MTDDENLPTRINVNITPDTAAALQLVIDRENVTLAEALRRLTGYGALVYRTIRVDGDDVLLRTGGKRTGRWFRRRTRTRVDTLILTGDEHAGATVIPLRRPMSTSTTTTGTASSTAPARPRDHCEPPTFDPPAS